MASIDCNRMARWRGATRSRLSDHPQGSDQNEEASPHDSVDEPRCRHRASQSRARHSDYLFLSPVGDAYTCAKINRALQRAAVIAAVPDLCLYTLRHSFVSRLVQAGVSLPEVAALAGDRDIRMTMRYARLAPQHLRNSIAILEARTIERAENALTITGAPHPTVMHLRLLRAGVEK